MGMIKNLLHEFKEFAIKGNAIDLAVGVVMGAAFGTIVKSLVDDIIMPPLGFLTGGVDFKDKLIVLKPEIKNAAGAVTQQAVNFRYGAFFNNVISFLIVAAAIFTVVKLMNMLNRKKAAAPDQPLTADQQLLTEIRDLLKRESKAA